MARRWADPTSFRADPAAVPGIVPNRRQSVALLCVLVLVSGAVALVAYLVKPDRARAFTLLHGSVLIGDQYGPVAVDLASGHGTLQISGAALQAGVKTAGGLSIVPFDSGTMLLNSQTGQFNMVDTTGFVLNHAGGVTIGTAGADSSAVGVAAGQYAYIERTSATGTDVLLVSTYTVSLASNPKSVKPRASAADKRIGSTTPGGQASANGNLWTLMEKSTGASTQELVEYTLPANATDDGARLKPVDHGGVGDVAALESATAGSGGTGSDIIGLATPGSIKIFAPGKATRTVTFTAPRGVDSILPVSNAEGRLTYLMHGTDGWSLVSAGTSSGQTGPISLGTLDPSAQLAPPAASLGSIYTIQRNGQTGAVYRIDDSGKVTAADASYPQREQDGHSVETASFDDAYLVARDSRVIVDSPAHVLALTLFTDDSHAPVVIQKSNLTSVNAATGPDVFTKAAGGSGKTPDPGKSGATPPKTHTVTTPQPDPRIDCAHQNVKPLTPLILQATPAARAVSLVWEYPATTNQDCRPSTYKISVQLLSQNAPSAPGSLLVNNQNAHIIGGLYPNTQYKIVVSAIINQQETPSIPAIVTTNHEGPPAPTGLTATYSNSAWHVAWSGCGSVSKGCVPAGSWSIQPTFCDGIPSNTPAAVVTAGNPTSVRQPGFTYPVNANGVNLLGRGLAFQVLGSGVDGLAGTVSASTGCVYSFAQPQITDSMLTASQPANQALGQTTTTTVTLNLGQNAVQAAGGVGSHVTLLVNGANYNNSQVFTLTSGQTVITKTFTGLAAGVTYSASAIVTTAHGGLTAQVGPKQVVATSNWPDLTINPTCEADGSVLGLTCTLTVPISGVSSAAANGETFNLVNSNLTCGTVSVELDKSDFNPGTSAVTKTVSKQSNLYGVCQVHIQLSENAGTTPVFGKLSPAVSANINLGNPPSGAAGNGDFSATWDGDGTTADVKYTGSNVLFSTLTQNFSASIKAPNGSSCGSTTGTTGAPTGQPLRIPLDPNCVNSYGSQQGNWAITINWQNSIGNAPQSANTTLAGPVPGYQPCTPAATDFTATWVDASHVSITDGGNANNIKGCPGQSWKFTLLDTSGTSCGNPDSSGGTSDPGRSVQITVACATKPAHGWTVQMNYTDPAGNPQTPITITLSNDPPS